jgi:hypothetical protein
MYSVLIFVQINSCFSLQLVSYLGIVLFHALDFGLSEEEERHLSPDLERLIDMMTAAGKLHDSSSTKFHDGNIPPFVIQAILVPAVSISLQFCTTGSVR